MVMTMKNEFDYLNDVKMDFSVYDPESEKEIKTMKNGKRNTKKICIIAACAAAVAITGTAFASGYVDGIIKRISTGHNIFLQTDSTVPHKLPDKLQGKFFDENGVALEYIADGDVDNLYDAQGNKLDKDGLIAIYEEALGGDVVVSIAGDEPREDIETIYTSIEEAQAGASFDIKVPDYLPEGFSVSKIYAYNDDKGNPGADYRTIEYTNGESSIFFFERLINDDTSYETGTSGELKEVTINGRTAALTEDSIGWETADGVSIYIIEHANLSESELLKIAKSVK